MKSGFHFLSLRVWQQAAELSRELFEWADELEQNRRFRFAEQLRAATLSVTNNLAEGSGSCSNREFAAFVNIARRSVFEVANMIYLLHPQPEQDETKLAQWLESLEGLSRQLYAFRKSLLSDDSKWLSS